MSAIASPEFVSLCHAQLRLLTQQMVESTAALYIADIAETGAGDDANFVPVVSYPEPVDSWVEKFARSPWKAPISVPLALPGTTSAIPRSGPCDQGPTLSLQAIESESGTASYVRESKVQDAGIPESEVSAQTARQSAKASNRKSPSRPAEPADQQLVVPLVYTEVVVGLLVAIRRDRPWERRERRYIETMADSLAAGCVLERRNQWLQSRIAHRRGLQSRQSEVFHNLLHQFRNPLTAVNTFGKLLVRRLDTDDPNQTVATGIVRETTRLRELVTYFDDAVAVGDADLVAESSPMLTLSPNQPLLPQADVSAEDCIDQPNRSVMPSADLSVGRNWDESLGDRSSDSLGNSLGHAIAISRQSIASIIDPILEVASIVAAEKGVSLHLQVAQNTPLVWGNEEALSEVVSNLVDNALKYSPAGAEVWIQTGVSRMDEAGHYQGIVVADTGPGIPPADLQRLFERYYRGVQAQGSLPGTGLGLAIAQSLVEEMHGAIEVVSPAIETPWIPANRQAAGPGTVFIIWLLEVS